MEDPIYLSPWIAKKLVEETPYHAYKAHYKLGGQDAESDDSAAKNFGSVVDCLVFGVGNVYVRQPRERVDITDHRTVVCTDSVYRQAQQCAESVKDAFAADGYVLGLGDSQTNIIWQADGAVWCKTRPDWRSSGTIVDLKTSQRINNKAVQSAIFNYGYDIQAAAALEGASACKLQANRFRFLFVESSYPYATRWVDLDTLALGEATAKWRKACSVWKTCLREDKWPGWDNLTVSRPRWAEPVVVEGWE